MTVSKERDPDFVAFPSTVAAPPTSAQPNVEETTTTSSGALKRPALTVRFASPIATFPSQDSGCAIARPAVEQHAPAELSKPIKVEEKEETPLKNRLRSRNRNKVHQ